MPGPIKGRASNPALPFIAKSLQESARTLEKSGIKRGGDAFAGVASTGAAALETTAHVVGGGFGGWSAEGVQAGAKYVAKGASRGLSGLASSLPRVVGEGRLTTVRELLADPDAGLFSEKMFGRQAKALQRSPDALALSWAAYGEALSKLLDVDAGAGAAHVAAVAGSLARAAALTTSPATVKMAGLGVRVANLAQQATDEGAPGARALTELAARFLGATASVLPLAEPGEVVQRLLASFQAELSQLQVAT